MQIFNRDISNIRKSTLKKENKLHKKKKYFGFYRSLSFCSFLNLSVTSARRQRKDLL